jgi:dienelactone hydrolase
VAKVGFEVQAYAHGCGTLASHIHRAVTRFHAGQRACTLLASVAQVGAIGFCMGGALSLAGAQKSGIDCGVAFYGLPGEAICQPGSIKAPVQLHFGRLDEYKGFSDPQAS